MENERILYPCYFNAKLLRSEGRRVARSMAVDHPSTKEILRACSSLGIECRIEEAPHPSYWPAREGRVVAAWKESKEKLIRMIATAMKKGK